MGELIKQINFFAVAHHVTEQYARAMTDCVFGFFQASLILILGVLQAHHWLSFFFYCNTFGLQSAPITGRRPI